MLNTHRAPPVRSALSPGDPRLRRRAKRQRPAGAGLQSRAPGAQATWRRALSWLGPRAPPTVGVTDGGLRRLPLFPPAWSVSTPRGGALRGPECHPLRQCRASGRRELGGGKGRLPKSAGQSEAESGRPAPGLGLLCLLLRTIWEAFRTGGHRSP